MTYLSLFSVPFILGVTGGSIPGPILTSIFAEVLANGFHKSFRLIFTAFLGEITIATSILTVVFSLNVPKSFFYVLSLAGAVVLIWMASGVWKIKKINQGESIITTKKIILLTVFNGPLWIFWLTVCVPQAFALKTALPMGHFLFLIIFESAWLVANFGWAFIFSYFRPLLTREHFAPYLFRFFALMLGFFAIKSIYESINFLF